MCSPPPHRFPTAKSCAGLGHCGSLPRWSRRSAIIWLVCRPQATAERCAKCDCYRLVSHSAASLLDRVRFSSPHFPSRSSLRSPPPIELNMLALTRACRSKEPLVDWSEKCICRERHTHTHTHTGHYLSCRYHRTTFVNPQQGS